MKRTRGGNPGTETVQPQLSRLSNGEQFGLIPSTFVLLEMEEKQRSSFINEKSFLKKNLY